MAVRAHVRPLLLGLLLAASVAWYIHALPEEPSPVRSSDPSSPWLLQQVDDAGVGLAELTGFTAPYGIALDPQGNLYVADLREGRVVRFDRGLRASGWLGAKAGGTPEVSGWHRGGEPVRGQGRGMFEMAHSIAFDARGRIYVADYRNARVHVYDADGRFDGYLFDPPSRPELAFRGSANAAIDRAGNIWVSDFDGHRVFKFSADGALVGWLGATAESGPSQGFRQSGAAVESSAPGGLSRPHMVQVDAQGFVYVVETGNNRVQKFSPRGEPLGWIGAREGGGLTDGWQDAGRPAASREPGGFDHPASLYLVGEEYFLIADNANHRVQKFGLDGRFRAWLGGREQGGWTRGWAQDGSSAPGREPGRFDFPCDAVQRDGRLYVADGHAGRVQVFSLPD